MVGSVPLSGSLDYFEFCGIRFHFKILLQIAFLWADLIPLPTIIITHRSNQVDHMKRKITLRRCNALRLKIAVSYTYRTGAARCLVYIWVFVKSHAGDSVIDIFIIYCPALLADCTVSFSEIKLLIQHKKYRNFYLFIRI